MPQDEYRWPCEQCGAQLRYAPGQTRLVCDHCGHVQEIPQETQRSRTKALQELDLAKVLRDDLSSGEMVDVRTTTCPNCGALVEITGATHATAATGQGERAGVVAIEHRRQACAICGGQLGQVGEQLADVGDLVGRTRLGDLALVLLVLDRIAHEGDQGFVGKGIDKAQSLVLQAQRVVQGELVGDEMNEQAIMRLATGGQV